MKKNLNFKITHFEHMYESFLFLIYIYIICIFISLTFLYTDSSNFVDYVISVSFTHQKLVISFYVMFLNDAKTNVL